ncbi:MAG: cytochrome c-type biogenesis protein CcmH [Ilumatobacteraceae bacterium]
MSRRLSWLLVLFVGVGALAVGATRDRGPREPGDRIDAISRRIACPVCDGESVYESRNPASEAIRSAIREGVRAGALDDDTVIAGVAEAYGAQVLLVPRATGLDALAWALPVTAAVVAIAALGAPFRRWRAESAAIGEATEEDRRIVERLRASADEAAEEP